MVAFNYVADGHYKVEDVLNLFKESEGYEWLEIL